MATPKPITVSIVEDDHGFLEGITYFLNAAASIQLMESYTNGAAAVRGLQAAPPDVTLIDLGLPDMSGIDVITEARRNHVPTEFLVLSVYDDDRHVFEALKCGAVGYIVKTGASLFSEAVAAIEDVINGGAPMSLGIARRVINEFQKTTRKDARLETLTHRETEILTYLSEGYSTRKAAEALFISYETVRCHQKNIYKKLQVNSLVQAVAVLRGGDQ